jgi:hypothetical protein
LADVDAEFLLRQRRQLAERQHRVEHRPGIASVTQ